MPRDTASFEPRFARTVHGQASSNGARWMSRRCMESAGRPRRAPPVTPRD